MNRRTISYSSFLQKETSPKNKIDKKKKFDGTYIVNQFLRKEQSLALILDLYKLLFLVFGNLEANKLMLTYYLRMNVKNHF